MCLRAAKPVCAIKALQKGVLTFPRCSADPEHMANLGNAYGALGEAKQQRDLLERALQIKELHYGPDHPEVAKTLTNLGNAYGALGEAAHQ
eukprot:5991497-Amphidinium_carterae.1